MKTRVPVLILLSCAVIFLAGFAVYAQLQNGDYQPPALGQLQQPAPPDLAPDSRYGGTSYPLYPPELAPGDGKAEVEGYCGMCHSTRYITMQPPLPATAWEAEVNKMKKALGATIPDAVAPKIIHYLQTHYTPETRQQ